MDKDRQNHPNDTQDLAALAEEESNIEEQEPDAGYKHERGGRHGFPILWTTNPKKDGAHRRGPPRNRR